MTRVLLEASSLIVLIALAMGCSCIPASSTQPPPFHPQASIREIMDAEIDPAADALWASVQTRITAAGEDDRQPRTEEEWKAVRRSALTLVEATNLLLMKGRRIVAVNAVVPAGEADPAVLQRRLDANRAPFTGFALGLQQVSLKALEAVDARSADRLLEVGGEIDEACEACHLVYWYPPDLTRN
ncbi:MAG TPA: hypothetical protein VLW26_00215 [Steroidobacteraceae bacterium]|nr:hypothetical protein [Steroidobacteraceae bacterium]